MADAIRPRDLELGEAIEITAWQEFGLVTKVEPAIIGSDEARKVTISTDPETDAESTYHLEPGQFTLA